MRFLADMGVSQRTVEWLRTDRHDVVHLRDQGLQRWPDTAIFEKAINEDRVLLTFDLDFGEIAALSGGQRKIGIVLFRLKNCRPDYVNQRLAAVLAKVADLLGHGSLVIVEDSRYRVRPLPIRQSSHQP